MTQQGNVPSPLPAGKPRLPQQPGQGRPTQEPAYEDAQLMLLREIRDLMEPVSKAAEIWLEDRQAAIDEELAYQQRRAGQSDGD